MHESNMIGLPGQHMEGMFSDFSRDPDFRNAVIARFISTFFNTFDDVKGAVCTLCVAAGDYLNSNVGPVDAMKFLEVHEVIHEGHVICVNSCVVPHTRTNIMNVVVSFKKNMPAEYIVDLFQEKLNSVIVPEPFGLDDTAKFFEFFRDNSEYGYTSNYIFLFTSTITTLSDHTVSFWIAIDNQYLLINRK